MRRAVINVACGTNYQRGHKRLIDSLDAVKFTGERVMFRDTWPSYTPPHSEAPYLFKVGALREAQQAGIDLALWMDASCWAINVLDPVFDIIQRDGAFIIGDAWTVGQWCTDECLQYFALTREQAHEIRLNYAICMGFDLRAPRIMEFMDRWESAGRCGMFNGPWAYPADAPEFKPSKALMPEEAAQITPGHRHDQTVASILIHLLGLPFGNTGNLFQPWQSRQEQNDGAAILARGI